jgi:hypothetical protein
MSLKEGFIAQAIGAVVGVVVPGIVTAGVNSSKKSSVEGIGGGNMEAISLGREADKKAQAEQDEALRKQQETVGYVCMSSSSLSCSFCIMMLFMVMMMVV